MRKRSSFTKAPQLGALGLILAIGMLFASSFAQAQTPCLSITSNGGNGNGTTDNTAAFNLTVAQLPSQGGCISFPAGTYLFNSPLRIIYPAGVYSVTIVGDGADNTTLYFPASNGITINAQDTGTQALQSIHVRDLTFTTGTAGTYAALTLVKAGATGTFAQSEVERTVFRGADGANLTDFWGIAVNVSALSDVNFDGDLFYGNSAGAGGVGISLAGNSTSVGTVYNIAKSGLFGLSVGVAVGSYVNGVSITQSNIVNGETCIWVPANATSVAGLTITGGNNLNCTGTQILLQSPVNDVVMNGNLIYVGAKSVNNFGLWIQAAGGERYSIVNNVFAGLGCCNTPAGTGIVVDYNGSGVVTDGVVIGNTFFNLVLGVDLTDASYWNVQANFYNSNTTTQVLNPNAGNMNSVGVATK